MNFLKREHAPITDEVWSEIDRAAKRALETRLKGRRIIDVDGPHGWDLSSVGLGRLSLSATELVEGVETGIRRSLSLVESRARCELDLWELDNISRNAKDVDFGPLEDAVRRAARFEDQAIFHGFAEADISGLMEASPHDPIELEGEINGFLNALSEARLVLQRSSIEGPYALVLGADLYRFVASVSEGYPLSRRVSSLVGGPVLESELVSDGLLASLRGGDFEMILGQDFSVGYETHDSRSLRLFVTESFTFRIIEPAAVARLVPVAS
jgi:uncharacterized linocin/CFP29 family protein